MTTLSKWSPLNRMLAQWPDLWDDDFIGSGLSTTSNNIDIYETTDEIVVSANVAGVEEKDIDLTFEKGVLWIKADKVEEAGDKNDRKHYSKASWSYSYKVAVPGLIDLNQEPDASIKDGVVTIKFKKSEATKPRKLKLNKSS